VGVARGVASEVCCTRFFTRFFFFFLDDGGLVVVVLVVLVGMEVVAEAAGAGGGGETGRVALEVADVVVRAVAREALEDVLVPDPATICCLNCFLMLLRRLLRRPRPTTVDLFRAAAAVPVVAVVVAEAVATAAARVAPVEEEEKVGFLGEGLFICNNVDMRALISKDCNTCWTTSGAAFSTKERMTRSLEMMELKVLVFGEGLGDRLDGLGRCAMVMDVMVMGCIVVQQRAGGGKWVHVDGQMG